MRYGENIDEVLDKPDWVCPVCRDLCNCSNHRIRKGWRPTGTLYRYVIEQGRLHAVLFHACTYALAGFKSVAHYLVLSNLAEPSSEASDNTAVSADSVSEPAEAPAVDQAPAEEVKAPAKEPTKSAPRTTALSGNKTGGIDAVLPKRRASRAASKGKDVSVAPRRTRAASTIKA